MASIQASTANRNIANRMIDFENNGILYIQ